MFTVCPKCALTLVVTATDLRVAQGYVRCGRCSNVFNALARLSEDRNAAAAAAASQGVPPSSTGVHPRPQPTAVPAPPSQPPQTPARPPLATGSFIYTRPPESPAPAARQPQQPSAPPARTQQPTAPPTRAPVGAAPSAHASSAQRSPAPPARGPQAAAPPRSPASPPPSRPAPPLQIDDDDVIPEDALEFNPDAADVNQVFVEPPPNPEWTAATGSFKAIVLKSEEVFPGAGSASLGTPTSSPTGASPANRPGSTAPEVTDPGSMGLSSAFSDDEFELDADFLSSTTEMRKLKVGLGDADADTTRKPTAPTAPTTQASQAPASAFTPHAPQTPLVPSAPHAQQAPSARLAPRGPLPETPPPQLRSPPAEPPSQQRSPFAEIQSQLHPSPADTPSRAPAKSPQPEPVEEEAFFEPQVVSKPPPRAAVKAFGLDAVAEPPPGRLAALARARVAPGAIELESPPPAKMTLLNSATLWSAGAGALVILLAAQIVNHYRNDLAATAQFNKPITALYAALGVHLTPRWDLHAYDVRQLGASVDSGSAGQIMVRASVKNGAHQPQPMPLLRVTLQDRFGNRIAARDVPPGSYLPRATADTAFLPAGQRIDAEMAFVDPGSNAVGFEIDACLPAPAGGIACANDPTSR
jgi:predicted Zn finger-like uncharacterized protein